MEPSGHSRSTRADAVLFAATQVIFAASRFLREFLIAPAGAAILGNWGAITIIRQYSGFSDFGFTNGLNRVLAQYIEAGEERKARIAMGISLFVSIAGSFVLALAGLVLFALRGDTNDPVAWIAVGTVCTYMVLEKAHMYRTAVLRSEQRIGLAGAFFALMGLLELGSAWAGLHYFGYRGLLVSPIIAILLALAAMYAFPLKYRPQFEFDKEVWDQVLKASVTMTLFGILNIAQSNLDQAAVWNLLGPGEQLGLYRFSATGASVVSNLAGIGLAYVSARLYRFESSQIESVRVRTLPILCLVQAVAATAGCFILVAAPPLVSTFFPGYVAALPLLPLMLLAQTSLALMLVIGNVFLVIGKGGWMVALRIGMLIASLIGYFTAFHLYGTLESVVWTNIGSSAACSVLSAVLAAKFAQISLLKSLLVFSLPAVPLIALAAIGTEEWGWVGAVAGTVGLALLVMTIWLLWRNHAIRRKTLHWLEAA